MADIDTGAFDKAQQQQFRMEQAQGMGVYLPQFNEYVQANASDTPTSLNYKYSTALGGKPRSDYFGMVELNRFENAMEKREGMSDVFFGSDTRRSVPTTLIAGSIKSFTDTVINKPLKLAYSLGADAEGYAKYFGEAPSEIRMVDYYNPVSNKMEKRDSRVVSMDADFIKAMDNYHAVENSIYSKLGLATEKKESEFAQGVAGVVGSLGASLALGPIGIVLFFVGLGGDVYEELRTKGVSPTTTLPVATAVGGAVGVLEKFNMDKIANRVVYKSMTTLLAKQGSVEAGTEMAQTGAEALITSPWRDDTALDVVRNVMTDGFYGFLGGVFGHAINNTRYKEELQKSQKKLIDAGFTEQDSKVIINNAYSGNENMAKLVETVNSQTQQLMDMDGNGDFDADKLKAQWDMFVDQEAVGLDDTTYNAVLDFQNGIYEDVIAQGKTEEEAESASTFARSMINAITREANEAGLDVKDAVKSAMVNILYSEGKVKYVDEQGQEVSTEEYDYPGDRKPQEGAQTYDDIPFFSLGVEEIAERKKIYKAFGEYAPISKTIELFKGNRSDTLTHEMGHHFFPIYIDLLVNNKKFDEVNKILNAVGATDVNNITREQWEGIVELGIKYLNTNEAPNVATRNMFKVAKDWMIDVYHTVAKKKDSVSPEVKDFFDNIIANDEASVPDINYLKAKSAEINKVLNEFTKGKEIITESGLTISDVENLRKALYARIPRQGRTLDTDIRSAGGIDVNSAMAKQFGYDSRRGSEGGFWVKNGAIKNEQDLLEFLSSKEYIDKSVGETYDETSDIWNQVENLIYNKEQAMNVKETEQQAKYENAIEASRIAQEMLAESGIKNIREFENKLRTVRDFVSSNDKTYIKDALRYVQRSMKKINNDYNRLVNSDIAKAERKAANNARLAEKERQVKQKEYVEALKKTYKDFVRSLPVNSELSAKLLAKADSIKTDITLNNMLENAKERAGEFVNKEVYKTLSKEIDSLVYGSMFKNSNKGKYDFESAKIFRELRNYSKLNRTQAEEEFELYRNTDPQDFESRLVKSYLYYKAYGDKVSRSGIVDLYDGMRYLAETAKQAKDEQDLQAKLNKQRDIDEFIDGIESRKFDKKSFAGKVVNLYLGYTANLESRLNTLAGPKQAQKFEFETVVEAENIKTNKKINKMIASFVDIYKLGRKSLALDAFNEMGKKGLATVTSKGSRARVELSKFDIMDMYLQCLNEERRDIVFNAYGKEQIEGVLSKLSDADKKFARSMQADIQGLWEDVNAQYFKQKGKDMGFIKNYWMATSDINVEADMYNTFRTSATSPSATKSRAGFGVVPNFENAWNKYNKYIANAMWYTNTGQQWQDLTNIVNNPEVSKIIEEKYGKQTYDILKKNVEALGIGGVKDNTGLFEKQFGKLISNYVGAKVSLNPVVFIGQLTSFTNYAENMAAGTFTAEFAKGLSHPKETIAYMNKYAGEFLKNRFSSGYNEDLKQILRDAGDYNKKQYGLVSASKKKTFMDAMSLMVRMGDIGAIVFGGYPRLKSLIDSGMPLAEAQRQFMHETLRAQQSSNVASLNEMQQSKGFTKLFTSFKNTSYQYARKVVDSMISYYNGDISFNEMAKTLTNYMIIQPVIWTMATNAARQALGLGDDDDEITDNIMLNMFISPVANLPMASEIANGVNRYAQGKKGAFRGVTQFSIMRDMERALTLTFDKDNKELYDYTQIVGPFVEMFTGIPIATPVRYIKKWSE